MNIIDSIFGIEMTLFSIIMGLWCVFVIRHSCYLEKKLKRSRGRISG